MTPDVPDVPDVTVSRSPGWPSGAPSARPRRGGRSALRYRVDRSLRRLPPPKYEPSKYGRWFPKTADVFLGYLQRWKTMPVASSQDGPTAGVVVMPWVSTAAPWYSIMLAIGLARRGRKVVLLWDDTGFPEPNTDAQNRAIGRVLAYVGQFFPVVRLTEQPAMPPRASDSRDVQSLRDQNAMWHLRGAPPTRADVALVNDIGASLERSLPFVRAALDRDDLDLVVVPGGVYGTSGLFRVVAGERQIRVATFDADLHVAQVCVDGVAAQTEDLPQAFDALWSSGTETRNEAIAIAREEFQRRVDGTDRYGFQAVPARTGRRSEVDVDVLIPLNIEWDTAALGKQVHFDSTADWVTAAVETILELDTGIVAVRQHPSERRPLQSSKLDIASILRERFDDDPRCRFIAADDPVNTYDLLHSARLVLPYVSTIGIEAAAIGKPVLVSGTSYYSNLGFVWSAASREEYFDLLRRGVMGELEPLPDQSDRAWAAYYLAAVRYRIWTDFTPQPDDFWRWCRRSPDAIFVDPDVSVVLEAIDRNIPVPWLRHGRATAPSRT